MLPRYIPLLFLLTQATGPTVGGLAGNQGETDPSAPTYEQVKLIQHPRFRYDLGNEFHSRPPDGREIQRRFTDLDERESVEKARKIAALVAKRPAPVRTTTTTTTTTTEASFFDYFGGKDDDDDDDDGDEEDDEEDEDEEEEEEDEYEEDEHEEDKKGNEVKDKKKPPFLRGVRRRYVRAHKIIFPLLLAYKLKFFTMLPLLVGSLVLLIGTTGIAGFFFALFSAALGLQVKSHH